MRSELIIANKSELIQEKEEKPRPPKQIWLTSLAHFSNDFYNGFLAPLLPLLVIKFDVSLVSTSLLVMVLSTFNSLIQPVTGILSDRLKRNYFIVFAALITGLFMSMIGVVNHYFMLIIILAVSGVGTSLFHPQAASLVGRIKTKRPGFSMSVFSMGGSLGITVGPLVIIYIVEQWGLSATIFTSLFALIVLLFTFPLLNFNANQPQKRTSIPQYFSSIKFELKDVWSVVSLLYFMVVIRATMTIGFHSFMPLYLTSEGGSTFLGATAVTVFQFCGTAGILTGGYISSRISPVSLLKISFLSAVPFFLLTIHFPSGYGLPFFGAAAFFLFSSTPINIILGQRLLPGKESFISGIMMGFAWGIGGLLMLVVGVLLDWLGFYTTFFILAFLGIPGFILAQFCPNQSKDIKGL